MQVQLILRWRIVEAAAGHAHQFVVAQRRGVVAPHRSTPLGVGEELRAQHVDAARVQLLDERTTAHRIAQQIAPVGQIERRRHGVKVARCEAEQIVEHEKVDVLVAQRDGERERALLDAKRKATEHIVRVADLGLAQVVAARVARRQRERVWLLARRALAHLVLQARAHDASLLLFCFAARRKRCQEIVWRANKAWRQLRIGNLRKM